MVVKNSYTYLDKQQKHYDSDGYLVVVDGDTGKAGLYYSTKNISYFDIDVNKLPKGDVFYIPVVVYEED